MFKHRKKNSFVERTLSGEYFFVGFSAAVLSHYNTSKTLMIPVSPALDEKIIPIV